MLQEEINALLADTSLHRDQKFIAFQKALKEQTGVTFSDFDDTISSNPCIYSIKRRFLRSKRIYRVLDNFSFHPNFLPTFEKIGNRNLFIVSRNSHDFLKLFVEKYSGLFRTNNIELLGYIGVGNDFYFSPQEKLRIIPESSPFITDAFEFHKVSKHSYVYCVNSTSYFSQLWLYVKKTWYTVIFLVGLCLRIGF